MKLKRWIALLLAALMLLSSVGTALAYAPAGPGYNYTGP